MGEGCADEDVLAVPRHASELVEASELVDASTRTARRRARLDSAVPPRSARAAAGRIAESARRRSMACLSERLVRSLVVVLAAKRVEGALLTSQISPWWSRGLSLERAMEAFLATILLWLARRARRDSLDLNAEQDPPYRQVCQPACGHGGERRPVVCLPVHDAHACRSEKIVATALPAVPGRDAPQRARRLGGRPQANLSAGYSDPLRGRHHHRSLVIST